MEHICEKYEEQGIVESNLSIVDYKQLINLEHTSMVPVFPKIEQTQKKTEFLSMKDLKYIKMNLINHVEKNLDKHYMNSLFLNKSRIKPNKVFSSYTTANSIMDVSRSMDLRQEVDLELRHNRHQLQQNKLLRVVKFSEGIGRVKSCLHLPQVHNYTLQQIRSYKRQSEMNNEPQKKNELNSFPNEQLHTVCWQNREQDLLRPFIREGHSFTQIGTNVYCYGGINSHSLCDIHSYELRMGQWSRVDGSGEVPTVGRNNHTAIRYNRSLVVFGGEKFYDPGTKKRECHNDMQVFNTENGEWRSIKLQGQFIEGRRAHQVALIGKQMIILGGITNRNTFITQIQCIDLNSYRLTSVDTLNNPFSDGIAFFTAISIYNQEFKYKPLTYTDEPPRIMEEGVYVFGGDTQIGQFVKGLHILKTNGKQMQWIEPETKGICPCPRVRHSLIFQEAMNSLVVYGGIDEGGQFLSDVCLLRMDNLSWCNVVVVGDPRYPLAGHGAIVYEKNMIVYGGYNENGFVGDVSYLQLELYPSSQLKNKKVQI